MNNNDYYPPPQSGEQHNMQGQQPRFGGGGSNRGGYGGGRGGPQGGGNVPRQSHHSNQVGQSGSVPQQMTTGGQRVIAPLHLSQQLQGQTQIPYGLQMTYPQQNMFYVAQQPGSFRYMQPAAAAAYHQYAAAPQQFNFGQPPTIINPQLYSAFPAYYPSVQGGGQNAPQQPANLQYYQPPHYPRPPVVSVSVPVAPVAPPAQTHPTHQTHQSQSTVVQPTVQGLVTQGQIQSTSEHREVPPPRQRKPLKILDPTTGRDVLENENERATSSSPVPTVEQVGEIPAVVVVSGTAEGERPDSNVVPPSEEPPIKHHHEEAPVTESGKKAKSEFYQLITAAADEGRGRSNSNPDGLTSSHTVTPTPGAVRSSPVPSVSPVPQDHPAVVAASAPPEVHLPSSVNAVTKENEPITSQQAPPVAVPEPEVEVTVEPVIPPTTTTPEIQEEVLEMPIRASGEGDNLLDISTTSVSPEPIEKYIVDTPEKEQTQSPLPDSSGEAVSVIVGEATRESTASPVKIDDSLPSSTPNQLSDDDEEKYIRNGNTEDEITKGIQGITISSVVEPTFQNGGNELESGEDEEMEEGEIQEDGGDTEGDGTNESEPSSKPKRIVYDRDSLLNIKSGSKDALQGMDLIPPELIRDGKAPSNKFELPRGGPPGTGYNSNYRNPPMGKPGNNRQGYQTNRPYANQNNWAGMGGVGGQMFQIPPPLPSSARNIPLILNTTKVVLSKDPNAWKPSLPSNRKNIDETKDEEALIDELKKRTRGILNKLTPENFDKLVQKFVGMKFENQVERIGAVIGVVFEKAIDEPGFSNAYARMVHYVCTHQETPDTSKMFRKKILDQCQKEFQEGNSEEDKCKLLAEEYDAAPDDKKAAIKLEMEERKLKARRRSMGNVRFIGELFKLNMLTPKIMVECINILTLNNPDEESYECLCKLLTTIGQKLEIQLEDLFSKKSDKPKWTPEDKYMEKLFKMLKKLTEDLSLSSRIRFALLDVCDLRASGWKPRRDANAPQTIDEVRRAAIREEQEEKNQIRSLPPAQQLPRGPMSQPKNVKNEWSTVTSSSNKSSRFQQQTKKPISETGGEPKFAPSTPWAQRPLGGTNSGYGPPLKNIPPRMLQQLQQPGQSRFTALSPSEPNPPPSREDIVQQLPPPRTPSSHSSRESSRPQTPTRERDSNSMPRNQSQSTPPSSAQESPTKDIHNFDVNENVKNIFNEFMSQKILDLEWIQNRYPGKKVITLVDELSRQVSDMTKEEQQKTAAKLIKTLVKKDLIKKEEVIQSLRDGVITEMPDVEVDVPKVASYLAMFLSELFLEEKNLSWLLEFSEPLMEFNEESYSNLVTHTLNTLKLRLSEEQVISLYKMTENINMLPIHGTPWIDAGTVQSVAEKMVKVLQDVISTEDVSVVHLCKENSWDLRQDLMIKGLILAICTVCYQEDLGQWNLPPLERFIQTFPNSRPTPVIWQQAKEFILKKTINKNQEDLLWDLFHKHDMLIRDGESRSKPK